MNEYIKHYVGFALVCLIQMKLLLNERHIKDQNVVLVVIHLGIPTVGWLGIWALASWGLKK